MAFNVSNFINKAFPQDGARPNLFEIELPTGLSGMSVDMQTLKVKCRASSIPSSQVGMVGAYYFGRAVKLAGTRTFSDWTVTVMMDESDYYEGGVRTYFEKWMSGLNAHVGNIRSDELRSPGNYMKDGKVLQYSKNGIVIAAYSMEKCFPVAISEMPLDWGNNNTISEFNVTFAMQWWTRENVSATDSITSPETSSHIDI